MGNPYAFDTPYAYADAPAHGRGDHRGAPGLHKQKRGNHVAINQQFIAIADSGNIEKLMSAIDSNLAQMNLVNISTALHRLAKLTASDATKQARVRQSLVFEQMVPVVREALSKRLGQDEPPHAQVLSNVAWALATVQFLDLPLLEKLADLASRKFPNFKPFELSSMLWAFAKFEDLDAAAGVYTTPFFSIAAAYMSHHVLKSWFPFRCLVMAACAFARTGHHDAILFHRIAEGMVNDVPRASSQEVSNVVWAFATAGVCVDQLFERVAQKCLRMPDMFKAQEIKSVAAGFIKIGYHHEELFAKVAEFGQCSQSGSMLDGETLPMPSFVC